MVDSSLKPFPAAEFGFAEAQHLLFRAGFGGTAEQIAAIQRMGLGRAVDYLVDYEQLSTQGLDEPEIDPDLIRPFTREEQTAQRQARQKGDEAELGKFRALRNQALARDQVQLAGLQNWWLRRMILTPRPLEENLSLLWHSHLATGYRSVEDAYVMWVQNQFIRENAAGSFATLALGIIRDPAMLIYLNNNRNLRARPNENLARELMELFTLGEGNYTEADIKDGARALTGYMVQDHDFVFRRNQHDPDEKTILGVTGPHAGEDFVKILLAQPACAEFIAYKLYRHFVADVQRDRLPESALPVIRGLAMELRLQQYELKPVLKKLFASRHFYDAAIRGAKIKSPIQLIVQQIRSLHTPARDVDKLLDAARLMGMDLFQPPNVAGWPGGRAWINTSTLFARQNTATYLITGKAPYGDWDRSRIHYDPMPLLETLDKRTPEAVTRHLAQLALGSASTPARVGELRDFMKKHNDAITPDMLIAMLSLLTAMPEYQLY